MHWEKAKWELYMNAVCCFEQILEATSHKTVVVWPPTSHLTKHPNKTIKTYKKSKDEFTSEILLWTPTHGPNDIGEPAKTRIVQLCADTGCSQEDWPGAIDYRDRWRERERECLGTRCHKRDLMIAGLEEINFS